MAFTTRDFSSQHSMDQHVAAADARDKAEDANRQHIRLERERNQALVDEAEKNRPQTHRFDWLNLRTPDEHPDAIAAAQAYKAGRQAFDAAKDAEAAAVTVLEHLEAAAALGRRDDAALINAHDAIERAKSGVRIAAQAVVQRELALREARERVKAAAFVNLRAEHRAVVRKLADALTAAAEHSRRAAQLQDASQRLFRLPVDPSERNTVVVRPLPEAAWRKDFHPTRGFFGYWLEFHVRLGVLDKA